MSTSDFFPIFFFLGGGDLKASKNHIFDLVVLEKTCSHFEMQLFLLFNALAEIYGDTLKKQYLSKPIDVGYKLIVPSKH